MDLGKITTLIPRLFIHAYQFLSSGTPARCRFAPSCSQYALDALNNKGLLKGLWLASLRLLKCHPWHSGGYDPISF